ncbi:unnamed protein product [Mycena citricolor]|uniref:Glycoside hydrolase family 71 protein n=1 Tax=Mycena citricolor TaxID=2018698 RepID=A0AAD2JWP7_9AGAR|nr:unnamed protein product [Mycena citricolor]
MVGNTYPYKGTDWNADMTQAASHGIDGFVLNVGKEDWQFDQVARAFDAAAGLTQPFLLFLSFDMRWAPLPDALDRDRREYSSIPSSSASDTDHLCRYLRAFGSHTEMYRHRGRVVVSTFAGENSQFGQVGGMNEAWTFARQEMENIVPIIFIPAFFIDPARYPDLPVIDGAFNWNGSWPNHLTPGHPRHDIEHPRLDTDLQHVKSLSKRLFMASHYGPDTWNKNWIYRGDDWLFVRRWEDLVSRRDAIDIIQIISWNDYGESHYICPTVRGAQPNSEAWVDGFPHGAWLRLSAFFIRAFKDGVYPRIERDEIFVWGRPHTRSATAPDSVPRPENWELTDDVFWVLILSSGAGTVCLRSGENAPAFTSISYGINKLSHPLDVGGSMLVTLERKGQIVAQCEAKGFCFTDRPAVYNFNAFTAMSQ